MNIPKNARINPSDLTRIPTSSLLPDGTLIDLFAREKEDFYMLTDLGQTYGWLYLQSSSSDIGKNKK